MNIIEIIEKTIHGKDLRIVFPEGDDIRIILAAKKLNDSNILTPILLGDRNEIIEKSSKLNLDIEKIKIINPVDSPKLNHYANMLLKLRNGKISKEESRKLVLDNNYFANLMLFCDDADGVVSGATHASSDTIRPALQIIKTRPGISRVSGAMLMISQKGEKYIYADIAVNTEQLDSCALAEIAIESARTARIFNIDPRVALLSFSTKGSAISADSIRMADAAIIAHKLAPNEKIDGELQFDAAIVKEIGSSKAPGSKIAGKANVFIFPDIQSGNIAYKITQHLAGFQAIGPLLQGLNKPVNDLSRGCDEDDIYKLAIITAAQSVELAQ